VPDLLVNLLKLPDGPIGDSLHDDRFLIRRARTFELTKVRSFIESNFSVAWADEASVGFANKPVTVFIATFERVVVGFAAYECTSKGFFGPTGVAETFQHQGVGKALLLASLQGLRELGYVYGIIGRAGPIEYYQRAVGAIEIPGSDPGIYRDLLRDSDK
jgi:predicted N-acetyltransferase YhbS